jgi:small subunit ribosomal protein S6e
MSFKIVVSDPKTRKSYQKEVSGEGLSGKSIGEKVSGNVAGLDGYELEITGGSDKDGFPMRKDVDGTARKKILISGPPGFHPGAKGQRRRKSVRGNTVSGDIVQINTKVVKHGSKPIEQVFKKEEKPRGKEGEEKKEEAKAEKKEEGAKPEEKPAEEAKEEEKPEEAKPAEPEEKPAEEEKKEEKEPVKEEPSEKKEEKPSEETPEDKKQ